MAALSARYFRLRCYNAAASYYRIGEIEIRAVVGGPTICVGGTAFGDGDYYPASRAFDGTATGESNVWAGNPGAQRIIGYDFGAVVAMSEAVITNGIGMGGGAGQHVFAFDFQYSNDNASWQTAFSVPASGRVADDGASYTYPLASFQIAGVITGADGFPAPGCTVRLHRRDTGAVIGSTVTSDGVTPAPDITTWAKVAGEGGSFSVGAGDVVRFGADGGVIEQTFATAGSYSCSTAAFGGADPAPGKTKSCELRTSFIPGVVRAAGSYEITTSYGGELQRIVLAPSAELLNDLIDRVLPQ